jgi:Protein of unknown function (DUF551).
MTDWDVAYWMAKYDQLAEDYTKLNCHYATAMSKITELENQWVSVDDKLPEDSGEYLVYIVANNEPKNKSIITLYYTNLSKRFVYYDNDNLFTVTHWCYLPEPPKE